MAVAQLERELGVALLERHYHRVALTPEGEALLPRAREVFDAIDAAREAVTCVRSDLVGIERLGTSAFTGPLELADVLHDFAAAHPRVDVHLRQTMAGSSTSLAEVRSSALDLALVSLVDGTHADFALDELHREPMVLACSEEHPLAGADEVAIAQLAAESFIDYPTGWGNRAVVDRAVVDRAFAAAGVTRTIRTEVTDFHLAGPWSAATWASRSCRPARSTTQCAASACARTWTGRSSSLAPSGGGRVAGALVARGGAAAVGHQVSGVGHVTVPVGGAVRGALRDAEAVHDLVGEGLRPGLGVGANIPPRCQSKRRTPRNIG